jgi:hypothetical protein
MIDERMREKKRIGEIPTISRRMSGSVMSVCSRSAPMTVTK